MQITTQHELLLTPNSVRRSGAEEGVILSGVMGSGPTIEDDFPIAGFLLLAPASLTFHDRPLDLIIGFRL